MGHVTGVFAPPKIFFGAIGNWFARGQFIAAHFSVPHAKHRGHWHQHAQHAIYLHHPAGTVCFIFWPNHGGIYPQQVVALYFFAYQCVIAYQLSPTEKKVDFV